MSNPSRSRRRRVQRSQLLIGSPEVVAQVAAGFTCPDCDSEAGRTWVDRDGVTHVEIAHDDGCPYLKGVTS